MSIKSDTNFRVIDSCFFCLHWERKNGEYREYHCEILGETIYYYTCICDKYERRTYDK